MVLALGKLREQYYVKLWVFCGNDMSPLQNHYWLMIIRDYNSQYLGFSTLSFPTCSVWFLNCVISTVPMKKQIPNFWSYIDGHTCIFFCSMEGTLMNIVLRSFNLSVVSHGRDFSRKKGMTKEGLSLLLTGGVGCG